jgi:hypothetical protein
MLALLSLIGGRRTASTFGQASNASGVNQTFPYVCMDCLTGIELQLTERPGKKRLLQASPEDDADIEAAHGHDDRMILSDLAAAIKKYTTQDTVATL